MSNTRNPDNLFSKPQPHLVDFAFDEQVASVFPDMIRRSVPGYETVISMLGVFAARYTQPGTHIYDLGCSLGAATLALRRHIPYQDCRIIAVDNSEAMVAKCKLNMNADAAPVSVDVRCENIQDTVITNASLVSLNFTLQFIPPEQRATLIDKLFQGMVVGGVLVLSEKVVFSEPSQQALFTELHHDFKRANGYSDLEISQKRQAIENVLVPDTLQMHQQRLEQAGFRTVQCWFQCFNFISLFAIK